MLPHKLLGIRCRPSRSSIHHRNVTTGTQTKKRDANATSAPWADEGAQPQSLPALALKQTIAQQTSMQSDWIGSEAQSARTKNKKTSENNNTRTGTHRDIESRRIMNRSLYQTLAHATATSIWGERTNHRECANPTAGPSLRWRHTGLKAWRRQQSVFGS